jgi:hypothetical protein
MAWYKYATHLHQEQSNAYDSLYSPGTLTPNSGIYRCEVCGHEVTSVKDHPLPPQTHPKHPVGVAIQWRLIVFAQHNIAS